MSKIKYKFDLTAASVETKTLLFNLLEKFGFDWHNNTPSINKDYLYIAEYGILVQDWTTVGFEQLTEGQRVDWKLVELLAEGFKRDRDYVLNNYSGAVSAELQRQLFSVGITWKDTVPGDYKIRHIRTKYLIVESFDHWAMPRQGISWANGLYPPDRQAKKTKLEYVDTKLIEILLSDPNGPKTAQQMLEEYPRRIEDGVQEGDELLDMRDDSIVKVLGVCGEIIFISADNDFSNSNKYPWTLEGLIANDYILLHKVE